MYCRCILSKRISPRTDCTHSSPRHLHPLIHIQIRQAPHLLPTARTRPDHLLIIVQHPLILAFPARACQTRLRLSNRSDVVSRVNRGAFVRDEGFEAVCCGQGIGARGGGGAGPGRSDGGRGVFPWIIGV